MLCKTCITLHHLAWPSQTGPVTSSDSSNNKFWEKRDTQTKKSTQFSQRFINVFILNLLLETMNLFYNIISQLEKLVSGESCTEIRCRLHFTDNQSMSDGMRAACTLKLCTVTLKTLLLNQDCALLQMTVYMHCRKHHRVRTEKNSNIPHLHHGPLSYVIINRW